MDVLDVALSHGRSAQLCGVGPDDGDVVFYFHSPATSGEELTGAVAAGAELHLRLLCLKRPTVECDEPTRFVDTVANDVAAVTEALGLTNLAILGWSGGTPYALAASGRLGPTVTSIHLVSPVPGPLTGPDAYPTRP